MDNHIIQVIAAFFGAAGFALVFNVRYSLIFFASFGGFLSWGLFLIMEDITQSAFVACFISSAFSAFYAEIMARLKKTPASVFFIPAVIPHVPGGSLFYTMRYAVQSDYEQINIYGERTLHYALGIACGVSIAWAIWYMCQKLIIDIIIKKRVAK